MTGVHPFGFVSGAWRGAFAWRRTRSNKRIQQGRKGSSKHEALLLSFTLPLPQMPYALPRWPGLDTHPHTDTTHARGLIRFLLEGPTFEQQEQHGAPVHRAML